MKTKKAEPSFGELLQKFEREVREHQQERLPDYKMAYRKDVEKTRLKLLEMYHRVKLGE